jgi:hypothetical protein
MNLRVIDSTRLLLALSRQLHPSDPRASSVLSGFHVEKRLLYGKKTGRYSRLVREIGVDVVRA